MRAEKHIVLPDEDADEFAALEAALVEELAPVGTLQTVLARRIAVAALRLARADRIETELFEERRIASGGLGLALIRDGNGPRSFETLLRYRGAAMAEFWRALRTLKALQAEEALQAEQTVAARALEAPPRRSALPPAAHEPFTAPNKPKRAAESRVEYLSSEPPSRGRTLHEPAAPWRPNEPEPGRDREEARCRVQAEDPGRLRRSNEPKTPADPENWWWRERTAMMSGIMRLAREY